MIDKIPDFLKFFVTLSNNAKLNIILLLTIFAIGYWSYSVQSSLQKERDDFKNKYDTLYIRYTNYVDKNQVIQNGLKDDCSSKFKMYREKKDAEVAKLVDNYIVKYNELLNSYKELIKNSQN